MDANFGGVERGLISFSLSYSYSFSVLFAGLPNERTEEEENE